MEYALNTVAGQSKLTLDDYPMVLEHLPMLQDLGIQTYYSPELLKSSDATEYWMHPDLRPLPTQPCERCDSLCYCIFKNHQAGDKDLLLRFAFAMMKWTMSYPRPRKPSFKLDRALPCLERHVTLLRITDPGVEPYSMTQVYFYTGLIQSWLENWESVGPSKVPFRFYSPEVWTSIEARETHVQPDLADVPESVNYNNRYTGPWPGKMVTPEENESYRAAGAVPEVPSTEVLDSHVAVFLEFADYTIHWGTTPTIYTVTGSSSHAHLITYIVVHIIQGTGKDSSLMERAREHIPVLLEHNLDTTRIVFWANFVLSRLKTTTCPRSDEEDHPIREFVRSDGVLAYEELWRVYYTKETWRSEEAKTNWVKPDKRVIEEFVLP
ncbi:hypothetical protein GE09DRAFT_1293646 [Coniochaeta sp. 2T2.1]|nr:hypothetical protein GE09DRAFT_1293646 [Coniochaeta sp. 2T2.1]